MNIIVATDNMGKLKEFSRILRPQGFTVLSRKEAGFGDPIAETGATFCENAKLKARAVFKALHLPALADDSGLCVDALGGAPGIYSARYASKDNQDADDEKNNQKLLYELQGVRDRTARYVCALCLIDAGGQAHMIEKTCEGEIAESPRGEHGFGYDPLFLFGKRTFGEMTAQEKDAVSHRGKALLELAKRIGDWI